MPRSEQIGPTTNPTSEKRSRSIPLKPTIWMTGVLAWATVIALLFRVPTWGGIFLSSLTGLSFLVYLVSYIFLMATDREALRAERYSMKGRPSGQLGFRKRVSSETVQANQNAPSLEPLQETRLEVK